MSEAEYVDKLGRAVRAKPRGERMVFFMPDEKANYGRVVVALDGAKKAGAETLGMMTEKADAPPELPAPGLPEAPAPTP